MADFLQETFAEVSLKLIRKKRRIFETPQCRGSISPVGCDCFGGGHNGDSAAAFCENEYKNRSETMRLNYFFRSPSRTVRLLLPAGVFLLVLAAGKNPGLARDKTCMEQDHRTFNVYIENDAIAGDDGQYTGGVKLTCSRYGLSALP